MAVCWTSFYYGLLTKCILLGHHEGCRLCSYELVNVVLSTSQLVNGVQLTSQLMNTTCELGDFLNNSIFTSCEKVAANGDKL